MSADKGLEVVAITTWSILDSGTCKTLKTRQWEKGDGFRGVVLEMEDREGAFSE